MDFEELYQDDPRDRTIFVEYFPRFILTSVWNDDGRLVNFDVTPRAVVRLRRA